MWKSIDSTASVVAIVNRAVPYYVAGVAVAIGFIMRLFNIGVDGQHQMAALFAAAFGFGIGSWGLPAPAVRPVDLPRRRARGDGLGGDRSRAQGDAQRQRGDLDDHAQLHRQPADLLPAARALGSRHRAGRRDRAAAERGAASRTSTACSRRSGSTSRPTSCCRGSCRSPSSIGIAYYVAAQPQPLRLRPPGVRPEPVGGQGRRGSTRSGWCC